MMFLLLVLIFVVSLPKAAGSMRRRQTEISFQKLAALDARTPPAVPAARENKQLARELKAAAKAAEQAEKRRQQIEQAQADKQFYLQQLEKIGNMLLAVDAEMERINQAIEIDRQTRSYDAEIKDTKKKEQITRKLLALENRQHALETKLAKANYIIAGN